MKALVRAWFSLFRWRLGSQQVIDNAAPRKESIGVPIRDNNALPWLLGLVQDLVQEHPTTGSACHKELVSCLLETSGEFHVWRKNSSSGATSIETYFGGVRRDGVEKLRAVCTHSLFIMSGLDWPSTRKAFAEFCDLSCTATRYNFAKGSVDTRPFIDPRLFAIAHPAQRLWFKASPANSWGVFKDSVHLVHPSARYFLLENMSALSDKDIDFLTATTLTNTEVYPGDDEYSDDSPPARKRRRS